MSISTTIRSVSLITPKRNEVSTPAEQNAFVASSEITYDEISTQLVADMNSFGSEANATAVTINEDKIAAAQSATESAQSAQIATEIANYKGNYDIAITYNIGETVTAPNGLDYVSKIPNNIGNNDFTDSTKWKLSFLALGAIGEINNALFNLQGKNSFNIKSGVGEIVSTRTTIGTVDDRYGNLVTKAVNIPRFNKKGHLSECLSENLFLQSAVGVTQSVTIVNGEVYTVSFLDGIGDITLSDGGVGVVDKYNSITFTATTTNLTLTVSGQADKVQTENKAFQTSYIETTTAPVTRAGDVTSMTTYDNIPNLKDGFTFFWEGTPVFSSDEYPKIVSNTENIDNFMFLYVRLGKIAFTVKNAGALFVMEGPVLESGKKIKVVVTADENGIVKMYVNSVLTGTVDMSSVIDIPLADLTYIGSENGLPNTNSVIHTENFITWDFPLSDTAIALLSGGN